MGCDIHAHVERYIDDDVGWLDSGDPNIYRNYRVFSVLANVRNEDGVVSLQDNRGVPKDCIYRWAKEVEYWGPDLHSCGWLTLREMRDFDLSQTFYCHELVLGRDSDGRPTATCRWSNRPTLGELGEITYEQWVGRPWQEIIDYMALFDLGDDTKVRLVFGFDN